MSEEENSNTPEVETPEITIPTTDDAAPEGDIVASKPDSKERQSAVIGSVDRPMAQQRRGPGGQGRRGGNRRLPNKQVVEEDEDALFEKVVHINR